MADSELTTPKPTRAEVPFAQVHQAVAAYVAEGGGDGVYENGPQLAAEMRERLRVDFTSTGPAGALGHYDSRAQDRFYRQVKTALDKLADAGVLRKAGAGSIGPDGRSVDRTQVRYYTPEAWRAAQLAHQQAIAAEQDRLQLSDRLDGRLRALGISAGQTSSGDLRLELSQLQALVELAEGGMDRHLASGDA